MPDETPKQTPTIPFNWENALRALDENGIWMADPNGPDNVTSDGRKVEVVARGMNAGTRHNSHKVLFEPDSVLEAIRQLDASLPGKDGHGSWGDSAYGDSAVYWHRVEMGQETPHPDGGNAFPVYFMGAFDVESDAAKRIRKAASNDVAIYTSVVVSPKTDGMVWGDEGPTISAFTFDALDFVRTPSDKQAKAQIVMDSDHSIIRFTSQVLNFEQPDADQQETDMAPKRDDERTQASEDAGVQPEQISALNDQVQSMGSELESLRSDQADAERRRVDADTLDTALGQLEELPASLRFDADRAIRKVFAELRTERTDDSADTLVELAYERGIAPYRKQKAEALLEEQRTAMTADEGEETPLQMAVSDPFEDALGRPAYERPLVAILEAWEQSGRNKHRIRGEIGTHHLPSSMDFGNPDIAQFQWEATRTLLDDMADSLIDDKRKDGPTYREVLIEEAKAWEQSGGDHNLFLRTLTDMSKERPGFWMATLGTDYVAPRSVDMMPINAIYPMLPAMGAMDVGMISSTSYTVTEEDRSPVPLSAFTLTVTGSPMIAVGGYYDLGARHFDRNSTFTIAGLTLGTDYDVDWQAGRVYNISNAAITMGNVSAAQRRAFDVAEGSSPAESKTTLAEHTEDLEWDEVRIQYTRRAEVEPLANAGYPTSSRLNFAGIFDIQEMIARDLSDAAWFGLRRINAANTQSISSKTDIDADVYRALGTMCAQRKDAGFAPTMALMSHESADKFTNLTDFFGRDGIESARVDMRNMITVLKGLPVMPMRFWTEASGTFPRLAIAQPPIARYRVLAQNGIRANTMQSMFDGSGNIVNGTQYIISVCHYIGSHYKNEHNAVLIS